ncbi:MAG: hypothetical protein JWL95_103 [Gemmatimonadetes bacterium]|nr:hypothetical protein [Gemmatimonadota bacterium]
MNDSEAPRPQAATSARTWLLLIHQLPPKPDYLRVKIRRRLRGLGAVGLKNTVYALPNSEEALEDFTWLIREIEGSGGSAMLCEAEFLEGITDEEIEAMLDAEARMPSQSRADATVDRTPSGAVWVTRENVFVDRIASAWLIRRFIDRTATFRFVSARGYTPRPDELRFDMFEAEYTHVGDDCTFETLLRRFGLVDPALRSVAEVVHDIDCKDDRFHRPETTGIAALLRGIVTAVPSDEARLERGFIVFDDLLSFYGEGRA